MRLRCGTSTQQLRRRRSSLARDPSFWHPTHQGRTCQVRVAEERATNHCPCFAPHGKGIRVGGQQKSVVRADVAASEAAAKASIVIQRHTLYDPVCVLLSLT